MNVYPDTVESEYVNVAEVLFVKLAGSELGVIVGAEGDGDANATDTAQPAPTRTRTQSNATSGLRLALLTVLFANRVT